MCCSVWQCVAVFCSVLQCVAVRRGALRCVAERYYYWKEWLFSATISKVCCNMLRVLQCFAVRCGVLQSATTVEKTYSLARPSPKPLAVCCSVLQCVAVCCSVLRGATTVEKTYSLARPSPKPPHSVFTMCTCEGPQYGAGNFFQKSDLCKNMKSHFLKKDSSLQCLVVKIHCMN